MNKELKPCPFCGGEAELVELGIKVWSPRCTQCECKLNQVYRSKQKAVEAWNIRKPMDEIVDKLEKAAKIYRDKAVIELSTEGHTLDYEHFEGKSKAFLNAIEIMKGGAV